jgi:FkbM family methyltransferase
LPQESKTLFTTHEPFHFLDRLSDIFVSRHLQKRARQNLTEGKPQVAVFAFDYIGQEINLRGVFERDELSALFKFLSPRLADFKDKVALDIGANIGNHSLFFSQHFRQVHAFEPNPKTFQLLDFNAKLAANISAHHFGLGAKKGMLQLNVDPLNVGEATLVELGARDHGGSKETLDVLIERLDDVVEAFGPIAFVKIDVEGFEADVVRGATAFLSAHKPIIAFEQNASAFVDGKSETIELLRDLGYQFCIMEKRNISGGLFGGLISILRKCFSGIEYDVRLTQTIAPDTYSMLVAIDASAIAALSRT